MLSINTNISSLITQSSMKQSTDKLNQAIERMTTGFKINHASDNAANYSISTNMTTKLNAYDVAADNVNMGIDLVTTASDTVSLMQDKAQRLRALCTQARNGTYGAQSLDAINTEANAIISEINRIYSTAQYNGVSLFTGGNDSADTAVTEAMIEEPAPVAMFAMARTMPAAETEGGFIADPITYSDEEVAAMTTMTQAVAEGSLVSGGTYSISTVDELVALADYVNSANDTTGMTFVLGADIDLSSISNWTPIGDYSTNTNYKFKGSFDGNGHVIRNLTIDNETKNYQGLFGYIESKDTIKNIGIEGGSVKGKSNVGGLVGYYNSTSTSSLGYSLTNCYATVNVTGTGYFQVGGLIGYAESIQIITNCYATGNVSGESQVGGLIGYAASRITNCYARGNVSGESQVGGLVGHASYNNNNTYAISNSYATGTVTGEYKIGGLVGFSQGRINNCFATGDVNGGTLTSGVSGGVGGLAGETQNPISNSYSTGNVTGNKGTLGGLVGRSTSSVSNSYATGNVTSSISTVPTGGCIGNGTATVTNCASVQSDANATQMTEEEIKAIYTPESMGFTEANGWTIVNGEPVIKTQNTPTPDPDPDPDPDPPAGGGTDPTPPTGGGGSIGGGSYGVDSFLLQVGINSDSSCQIEFDINFSYDLSIVGADIASDEALNAIDDFINQLSEHETMLGAVQNRLESALESIMVNIENLTSSRSTIRDADIAEVSSHYIQQQILQQASATLLATANQSPAIALQLI